MAVRSSGAPPLLKWPGGKRHLLRPLRRLLPTHFNCYIEPFAGGAALFFALQPPTALLADVNERLMEMYAAVRDEPDGVYDILRRFSNDESTYYRIRDTYSPRGRLGRAARFLYLQRLAFNGIYRENLRGEFNVPYGYKTHIAHYSLSEIRDASNALKRATLRAAHFHETLSSARPGDLVYLDPPYTVSHNNNGFIKYNQNLFSWAQQVQLANLANELAAHGVHVLASNAYHMPLLTLYSRHFRIFEYKRHSIISSSSEGRRRISEGMMISRFSMQEIPPPDGLVEVTTTV